MRTKTRTKTLSNLFEKIKNKKQLISTARTYIELIFKHLITTLVNKLNLVYFL
jgi:hypothetical protein